MTTLRAPFVPGTDSLLSAAMHPVMREIARTPREALIALDFDGTLAPIVDDPALSRAFPGAIEALAALAGGGVRVAIVTGRDALTVVDLGQLQRVPGLLVSGLHGAQTWSDGQLISLQEPSGLAELRTALPALLGQVDPGVWLEDKGLSLVVHTRRAEDPAGALAVLTEPVTALAVAHGLDVVGGKFVLEIRIPSLSKADAVGRLLEAPTAVAVFCGDDLGDLPAFEALKDWAADGSGRTALAVSVGEAAEVRQAADLVLDSPAELTAILVELAELVV